MLQEEDKNILPSLDWIILFAVFILGISFSGLLLPMTKTTTIDDEQGSMLPYSDNTSDDSLQIKGVKFNVPSTTVPETEAETCDGYTSSIQSDELPMISTEAEMGATIKDATN